MGVIGVMNAQLPAVSFYHLKRDVQLFSSSFNALAEDPYGFIWFGSRDGGGLYRYDGYELRTFLPEPTNLESSVSGARVFKVMPVGDSLLYVGFSFGFSKMNLITGEIQNFHNQLESMSDWRQGSTCGFVYDTLHNSLWIATLYGLVQQDLSSDQMVVLRPEQPLPGGIMPDDFISVVQDPQQADVLWLAGPSGMFSYRISTGQYTPVKNPSAPDKPLAISELRTNDTGHLMLGTMDGKLALYEPTTGRWQWHADPAPENPAESRKTIYKILPATDSTLWVSSVTGVGILNLISGDFEGWTYQPDYPDGLLPRFFYRDMLNDRHGRLWVASVVGMQYAKQAFMPRSEKVTQLRVAITDVQVVPIIEERISPLLYTGSLQLSQEQRDVSFKFVLPNPLNPTAVTYRYKLEGYDQDWITTDQRKVRYPRLGGGSYTFVITAREGQTGAWLPETKLDIHIPRRLTEQAWFWTLMVLLLLGISVAVYRYLIVRARKEERVKAEFEHQLSEIQMQALRAQMNPHFLFNSLNSIKYFAISKSKDETAAYLSKFAMLVRAILNNSKARTISLKDELDALQLYIEIEHLRLEAKFDYHIDIDSGIHIRQAQIPPMILQPYVENAIWHGLMHKEGKGRLLVRVADMGHQIQCIIEDNGIGRARSNELRKDQVDHKKSIGMQITSDRISLINKIYGIDTRVNVVDLTDEEGRPSGTRVVIHIPLIRDEEE